MQVDIIFAFGIAAVILFFIAQMSRIIRSQAMHKTLRKGIEQGQVLTPALIAQFDRPPVPGVADQRIGFVLIALGLALMAAGAIAPPPADFRGAAAISMFPLFVGIALLLRLRMAAKREAE
jgi:hypothetical protein